MIQIGVIIPDRGDREHFSANWLSQVNDMREHLIESGTGHLSPTDIIHVDYPPKSNAFDITERYRMGYHGLNELLLDIIFFLEVDDWYSPDYFKVMIEGWIAAGRPDLFGIDYTYYYHIKLKKYFKYEHSGRASMMCTAIKPDLDIPWPKDNYPFTDMHLWKFMQSKKTFRPEKPIAIGMKGHGIGMAGGTGHTDRLQRYTQDDQSHAFLKGHLDSDSYNFFSKL